MRAPELDVVEKKYLKEKTDSFAVGDVVKVHLKVQEGDKTRTQVFEGTVIRKRGSGISATFTVLKAAKGTSYTTEKTFPIHSPVVEKVKVMGSNKVKRAKLYFMRAAKVE